MHDIHIRPLHAGDSLERLTALLHRAFAPHGRAGLPCTCVDPSSAAIARRAARGLCLVAEAGHRFLGTVVLERPAGDQLCALYRQPGVVSLHQFAVDPEVQRHGVGFRLLQHADAWARQEGYRDLALDTPIDARTTIAYCERRGFARVGSFQKPDKPYRSVVMRKRIDNVPAGGSLWYSPHRHQWFGTVPLPS